MGCPHSKSRARPEPHRPTRITIAPESDETVEYSRKKFDEMAIEQLRNDFDENFEMFLLNNILMSVMFYENFDDEILKAKTLLTKREQDLNDKLIREHSKQCIIPDTLYDRVNQRVHFKRKHGPKKDQAEPLVPTRMFIIHDTIEILKESEDLDHYSGIDKPTHRVNVESSTHAGYAKLKLLYFPTMERCTSATSLTSGSSTYANGQALLRNGYNKSQASSSSYSDSDEYDYARINRARTELPIHITDKRNNSVGLPPGSIIEVKTKNYERENLEDDMYLIERYINSEIFMKFFRETDFPGNFGKSLGFSQDDIKKATHTATSIFCSIFDISKEVDVRCEILPAVKNPFPDLKIFQQRDRPRVTSKTDNLIYVFPTPPMLKDIGNLSSIVVPRGFLQKKGENKEYKFEWETLFPKAERHIQVRMFHGQIRCFLFLVILHKAFIEPITQHKGLVVDHLRNLIFWECEKNYKNWPEHRLGNKLLLVLRTLQDQLSQRSMPDYFIEKKNVFCNIPGSHLYKAQEQIYRVMENPVIYAIAALRNVHYASDSFYPKLDFDKLYKLLTKKGEAEKVSAPSAMRAVIQINPIIRDTSRLTKEQKWEVENMERQKEKKRKDQEKQKILNLSLQEKRESIDSIDLKFTMNSLPIDGNIMLQRTFLLFFMEHFLEIVECSHKYKAWNQYSIYLDQVKYLNAILAGIDHQEAKIYHEKIKAAEEIAAEQREYVPTTPTIPPRNSLPNHTGVLLKNQLKQKPIDISNMSKNYQMGMQKTWLEMNRDQRTSPTKKKEVRLNPTAEAIE